MKTKISEEEKRICRGDREYIFKYDNGNGIYTIYNKYLDKCNIFNTETSKLICKEWYYRIGKCHDGYCVTYKQDKIVEYRNGCLWKVEYTNEYNFVDLGGNILSENWFVRTDDFFNGTGSVVLKNDNSSYFIDIKGNIIHCTYEELLDYTTMKCKMYKNE